MNSFLDADGKMNRKWSASDKGASIQVKPETEQNINEKKYYVEINNPALLSLRFSENLDFDKENMYRFSFRLKGKAANIKKDTVNVRVIYLNITDRKIDNKSYQWFYFKPENTWGQKNVIILPPNNENPWNKAEITVFFEPGQYDVKDMYLETW